MTRLQPGDPIPKSALTFLAPLSLDNTSYTKIGDVYERGPGQPVMCGRCQQVIELGAGIQEFVPLSMTQVRVLGIVHNACRAGWQ